MPIECVYFDHVPQGVLWQPGWIFPLGYDLSDHYRLHVASERPPLSVILPLRNDRRWEESHGEKRGTAFCVDSAPFNRPHDRWDVVVLGELIPGEKPDITVRPSINAEGIYHGWLTNGVLSDDLG